MSAENLDAMSESELQEFVRKLLAEGHDGRERLTGKSGYEAERTAFLWARYAKTRIQAMTCRRGGQIGAAKRYEDECDKIYGRMEASDRW